MIYLDYAATTPMKREVLEAYMHTAEMVIGNASSLHSYGREAKRVLNEARKEIARKIGARPNEIIFTSGGTEADNLAVFGLAKALRSKGRHIITTEIEHQAILQPMKQLEEEGFAITYLPVDTSGFVQLEDVERALQEDTIFVSIMFGNNEVGSIQPISEIGQLLKERDIPFHTDAVQAYGTVKIDVEEMHIDALTASAHKIGGPKGIGFLYVRSELPLMAHQVGGNQERKLRGGTENIPAIAAFAEAVRSLHHFDQDKMNDVTERFLNELAKCPIQYEMNSPEQRLAHIVNIYFPHITVDHLLARLDLEGVAISSGSACTAGAVEASHVLVAMFGEGERANSSVRISFGEETTLEEATASAQIIGRVVETFQRGKE